MLEGGEDPLFIGRRLVRIAAEDVGLGDPQALPMAVAAMQVHAAATNSQTSILPFACKSQNQCIDMYF